MPTHPAAALDLPAMQCRRPRPSPTCAQISCALGVREWMTVTVASSRCNSSAAGMPTMLDRPTTAARLPASCTPDRLSSSRQPLGVHDTNSGSRPRMASAPMLSGWKPSTSCPG